MIKLKKMSQADKEVLRSVIITLIISIIFTILLFAGIYKQSLKYKNGTMAVESSYEQESSGKSVILTPQIRINPEGGISISHMPIVR